MRIEDPKQPRANIEEVEFSKDVPEKTQKEIIKAEQDNASRGRNVGLLVILIGVLAIIGGLTGLINIDVDAGGLNAKVVNASPGIVLMLIGLVIVWRTNLSIKAK